MRFAQGLAPLTWQIIVFSNPRPMSTYLLYIHIYVCTPFTPFLDSTTRENNDSATYSTFPRATFLFFTDSEFQLFASRTRGHYPFQQKVTRERMSTRERGKERRDFVESRIVSIPPPETLLSYGSESKERERESLFEKGSAKFS